MITELRESSSNGSLSMKSPTDGRESVTQKYLKSRSSLLPTNRRQDSRGNTACVTYALMAVAPRLFRAYGTRTQRDDQAVIDMLPG